MNPNDAGGSSDIPAPNPNDLGTDISLEEERALVDASFGEPGGALWGDGDGKTKEGDGQDDKPNPTPGGGDDPGKGEGVPNPDDETPTGTTPETPVTTPETPTPEEPKPAPEAPQEVVTDDLFVELEDANGKSFKIGVNDPIPDDLVFKNDAQLAELAEARLEMKGVLRDRQTEYEQSQQAAQTQAQEAQEQAAYDAEIQALIGGGLLEAPKNGPADGKKYTPDEVKADPALQKIVDIFALKNERNLPTFSLAHALYQKEQADKAAKEEQDKQNQVAKDRSALIGGSSSGASGGSTGGLYQQGSAGSIHDLDFSDLM